MKRYPTGWWVTALFGAAVVAALSPIPGSPLIRSALAATDDGGDRCSVASVRGTFVVSVNGFTSSPPFPPSSVGAFAPVMEIGTFTFDGAGVVSRAVTVNVAGLPFPVADIGTS